MNAVVLVKQRFMNRLVNLFEELLEGLGGLLFIAVIIIAIIPVFLILLDKLIASMAESNPSGAMMLQSIGNKFETILGYYPFIALVSIFIYIALAAIRKRKYEQEVYGV